ncbi:MAG: hypothetical protein K1X91_15720 [Bacteriodetes bacterium]|nr:hypothetical protein [Bacteroidota bacterium]
MKNIWCLFLLLYATVLQARTLEVGSGKQYQRLQQATASAQAGDTILINSGVYSGGDFISNLNGNENAWIVIRATERGGAIFRGGSQAFQMSEASYIRIENLVFEQQTANGVNIDDGGTYETPTHHLHIENCEWRSMNATGNNDELKLSGIDDFVIRNCILRNGAKGGSLIDMVGCHRGTFINNIFENGGSNAIQAKGATSEILIQANKFVNCGDRTINIGGSTGLEFFRPLGAKYEAKAIQVYSNIFIGSVTPIAYVGAVECKVENNTIYKPTRWALRILQETTAQGFLPCGNNTFRNNIIVIGNTGTVAINVGGNTAPETFTFEYNLWYNPDNTTWSGPNTPVTEPNRILNKNPLFMDTVDFRIPPTSPAYKAGSPTATTPAKDYHGTSFIQPRSIGAVEFVNPTEVEEVMQQHIKLFPNPAQEYITIQAEHALRSVTLTTILGEVVSNATEIQSTGTVHQLYCYTLPSGTYILHVWQADGTHYSEPVHILR